jgi:quinol-cytochrome oxidoreductase complex cytochrome b subunit
MTHNFSHYPGWLTHNLMFTLGFSLLLVLGFQVCSGILLSSYFVPNSWHAFESIINNSLDVSCNYPTFVIFLHIHQNGSSYLCLLIYVHVLKAVLYGSARRNYLLWLSGFSLLTFTLLVCFLGYVLPFGQMSYWAAIVIVSVVSVIPYVGANAL